MRNTLKNLLLSLLVLGMLLGLALAVPAPDVTPQAQQAYMNEGPADADDEYAFLFDE